MKPYPLDEWVEHVEHFDVGFPIRDNADLRGLLDLAAVGGADPFLELRKMFPKVDPPTPTFSNTDVNLSLNPPNTAL